MSFRESSFLSESDDSGRSSRNSSSCSSSSGLTLTRSSCSDNGGCMAGPGMLFRSRLRPSITSNSSPRKKRRLTDSSELGEEDDFHQDHSGGVHADQEQVNHSVGPNTSHFSHNNTVTRRQARSQAAGPAVVTLRSVYEVEITGRTADGRVIDRLTSIQNMSRSTRRKNRPASSPRSADIDYAGVDRYLNDVDDDNMSTASSASSSQRYADWERRSEYAIAAPAAAPAPHTPESAVFTRFQCRKCRPGDNPCPVHDHLNEMRKKRTPNGTMRGGDVADADDGDDDDHVESGVDMAVEDVLPDALLKSRRKAASTTASSPNRSAATATPLRGSRNQPLAAFSDDEEPATRRTIRRHHFTTYNTTSTRRLKPGEDPDAPTLQFDGSESIHTKLYMRCLFYGCKVLGNKWIKILLCFLLLSAIGLILQSYVSPPKWAIPAGIGLNRPDAITLSDEDIDRLLKANFDKVLEELRREVAERKAQNEVHEQMLRDLRQELTETKVEFDRKLDDCTVRGEQQLTQFSSGFEKRFQELILIVRSLESPPDSADDEESFKKRVWRIIWSFYADKTGRVDYAMESGGGSIVSTRCSKTYKPNNEEMGVFGISLLTTSKSPRTVITPNVDPGNCWAFSGHEGYLLIKLSRKIVPEAFTYEHVQKEIVPGQDISSAPKEFIVMGLHDEYTTDGDVLGRYEFVKDGDPLQTFAVQPESVGVYEYIELRVTSNWGNPAFTCLYRFRVHGREPRQM